MPNPLIALTIGLVIGIIAIIFIYPRKGILSRLKRSTRDKERVLIEDTLKHLYDFHNKNLLPTNESIKGILNVSQKKLNMLLEKLNSLKLITQNGDVFHLTEEGRSYALKVIRIHRLWEYYLADKTGVNPKEWHLEAEKFEHKLSSEDANKLAAEIGNPIFDPHGDPIPNEKGEIVEVEGIHLNDLSNGETAKIIHVEDEPHEIYEQLVTEGIYNGMEIRVIENNGNSVKFEGNGDEFIFAKSFCRNVLVKKTKARTEISEATGTLSSLDIGEEAEVVAISKACIGMQRRRLMDFGIVPGTKISAEMKSLGGDPTAYKVRGTSVALRKNQSDLIFIKNIKKAA
ncbi:MAG: DNA-binding protein [Ignavibacteriae bacterium]|jgi:DtxR family Mn-dependent transcriptional regulator|nr:DNA-binding protein [Ignavibacteriota bacterium]